MKLLVTGGAGYIGSHTCVELLNEGHQITVVDNLSNSKEEALARVEYLSGKKLSFFKADLLDRNTLQTIFQRNKFDAAIHFAGLKAPGESVSQPLSYYHNNISGTLTLLEVMKEFDVKKIVFSSSATVYGDPTSVPVKEHFPCHQQSNPYGRTKRMIEQILEDLHTADSSWNVALLRYFNPVGAHESGQIGEDPRGIPNNLMPYIAQVAIGRLPYLKIFGNDYPTPDGTGVRDYIHVVDLSVGHLRALEHLQTNPGVAIFNLGTNRGFSVLEMVAAFEKASGRKIPVKFVHRRPGDIAISYADVSKANQELGWNALRNIDQICADTWRWQSNNPDGYKD